jgi:hypothetical protein
MLDANPLKQYFRRPSIYLKLPSGGVGYPEGTLDLPENGEIPIYPMTAIDEITSRTPDSLYSGSAVVELIKSCAPNIKDPWFVNVNDLDPILVAIRAATNGNLMEVNSVCPSCEEEAKYDVNLAGVLNGFKPGDYSTPLVINDVSIKFRPLPYKEINQTNIFQFEVQKMMASIAQIESAEEQNIRSTEVLTKIKEMTITLLSSTIEYIKVPEATVFEPAHILEFLQNCDKQTFEKIKDKNVELRENTATKPLKMKCMHCQHEYEQTFTINITDFFV